MTDDTDDFELTPQEADAFWDWMKREGGSKELRAELQTVVGRNEPCPCG